MLQIPLRRACRPDCRSTVRHLSDIDPPYTSGRKCTLTLKKRLPKESERDTLFYKAIQWSSQILHFYFFDEDALEIYHLLKIN